MVSAKNRPTPTRAPKWLTLWVFAVIPLLLLATLGTTGQTDASFPAGETLTTTSPDALLPVQRLYESGAICYIDDFETDSYTAYDPVILRIKGNCTGTADRDDIQLSGADGNFAGQRVGTGFLNGRTLSTPEPAGKFWYHDEDDSGSFSLNDPVYVKMHQIGGDEVGISDIRVTGHGNHSAGSMVKSGDSDVARTLKPLGSPGEVVRFVDTRGNGNFTSGDLLYLSFDPSRSEVSTGDLRLLHTDQDRPYASPVAHGQGEAIATITMLDRPVCYVDRDNTTNRSPGDLLILSLATKCTGALQTGDILLSRSQNHDAGSRVDDTHLYHGANLQPLSSARLAYIDQTNTTTLTRDDYRIIQIDDPGADEVRPWDLLLTPTTRGAGTVLHPDDPLIGTPLIDLGPIREAIAHTKSGTGSDPTPMDAFYLAPGAKTGDSLRTTDIRLTPMRDHPFAGPVGLETGEIVPGLTRKTTSVCTTNEISDEYRRGDPVYLRLDGTCPNTVEQGLLRLVPVTKHPGFTIVQQNDTDLGEPLIAQPDTLEWRYHDENEDSVFNPNEMIYLDIIDPEADEVQDGDIRITTLGTMTGGAPVRAGYADLGSPLTSLGKVREHTAYIETDQGRTVYITQSKTSTVALIGDVRLTALHTPFQAPEAEAHREPPTSEPPPDPQRNDGDPETDPDTEPQNGHQDDDEEEEIVPAPAVLLLLAVITGWASWKRRKQ